MKKIIFYIALFILTGIGTVHAQYAGKRFISGSAGIDFDNTDPKNSKSINNYGYNFDISLGKFKSETKASGIRLSSQLAGGKSYYSNGNYPSGKEWSGVKKLGFGVGYFWQYYKHFGEKFGIYGGPDVNVGFLTSKELVEGSLSINSITSERKTDQISLGLGLSAGTYYKLSERWWLTGTLAFSQPVSVSYDKRSLTALEEGVTMKSNELNYQLTPTFTFPSVSLGVRYICK